MNPFDHQQDILTKNPSKHLLAWGTGTGKTGTSLMLANKNATEFLVVCPKTLKENWKREVVRWLGIQPVVFDPKNKDPFRNKPQILIMSKEEFRKWAEVMPCYDCVIVDEAHYFAGIKSQLSKALAKYFRRNLVTFRYLLTATPFLRNAWNIFVLGKLLDQPWEYIAFRYKFFYERPLHGRTIWDARPGMEQDAAQLVHLIGSTVKLSDCVDMPEAIFETEYFKITKQQEAAIKSVKETLPIVRFTKYHQIAGGCLKGNEYEPTTFIESEKVQRVLELADENDKMIVSCRYLAEMEMLRDILFKNDHNVFLLNGATENKQEIIDLYNGCLNAVLLVNAACSEGWSVASAGVPYPTNLIVFYSYDFSLKNKTQMEGRVRRIDLPQKVTYISLITQGSIDEAVLAALNRKMDFDAAIYDYQLID